MSVAMELAQEVNTEEKKGRGRPKGSTNGEAKGKARNKFMKPITLSMLRNEYVPEKEGEETSFYNEDYVLKKLMKEYINSLVNNEKTPDLKPIDKEEWINIASAAWEKYLNQEQEKKQEELKEIISKFKNDAFAKDLIIKEFGKSAFDLDDEDEEDLEVENSKVNSSKTKVKAA